MTEYPPPPPGNFPPPPPGNFPPPPPGNFPPPPPGGYPPAGGYPGAGGPPDNNLVWGILVTIFCCLPFGIVSIVKATQVSGLWQQGRPDLAQAAADEAKKWAMWGAIAGVVVAVLYVIFVAVLGVFSFSTSSYSG